MHQDSAIALRLHPRDVPRAVGHNPKQPSHFTTSDWTPAVDIKEEGNAYILQADLPGVEPKDIEITLEKGILTLKGQRASEPKEEAKKYRRVERVRGTFLRRFSLPDTVETEKGSAKYTNGVLEVIVPKGAAT